jgi:hypothetical protein
MRPVVEKNVTNIARKLGVDIHHFAPSWKVVQKLMLQSFLEKGDFCWHCHTGIFAYPMWVALRNQIPLIFWGEPSAEYTAYYSYDQPEAVDEKRFNRFVNLGISAEDMLVRLEGLVEERDLRPFSYPSLKELRKLKYCSVCLGSYIPWDVRKQVDIIKKELGWKGTEVENVPPGYSYEKIECQMQGVRDFMKYIKRGYTRPSHLSSIDIRHGRMTREKALKVIEDYEGKRPPSLDLFLEFTGITEDEFLEITMSHMVSPFEYDPGKSKNGTKTPDFGEWCREGAMLREEAEIQLERWRSRRQKN